MWIKSTQMTKEWQFETKSDVFFCKEKKRIMREVRSNSLIIEERSYRKIRQRQTSVGSLSVMSPLSKGNYQNRPIPSLFVTSVPVINVPTDSYIKQHKKFVAMHISQNLAKLQQLAKEPSTRVVDASVKTGELIQETGVLLNQRKNFLGRGLRENRKMFFLMDYLNNLRIEESTLKTRDYEVTLEYIVEMQKFLQSPADYTNFHVVVDLNGYLAAIPNRSAEIAALSKKIKFIEKLVKVPQFIPPPQEFEEQLIYPTSSTYKIFKEIEKKAKKKTMSELFNELKQMTDDPEELDVLLNHAFTFGWNKTEFPFIGTFQNPPTYYDEPVRTFDPPYMPDEFLDMTINELRFSDWPYSSVVDILDDLFFIINPIDGAKKFYQAMDKAAQCVSEVTGEEALVDFDTLFPLILLSVLASGLVSEPRILQYIASLSTIDYSDSHVTFAASYVEAILTHISSLKDINILGEIEHQSSTVEAE